MLSILVVIFLCAIPPIPADERSVPGMFELVCKPSLVAGPRSGSCLDTRLGSISALCDSSIFML